MKQDKDTEELAKRFLDLWQDQAQAIAADMSEQGGVSNFINAFGFPTGRTGAATNPGVPWMAWPAMMAEMMAASAAAAAKAAGPAPGAAKESQQEHDGRSDDSETRSAAPGPAAASAPSGDGLHDLDELLGRIDALEKRLAAFESASAGIRLEAEAGGKPQKSCTTTPQSNKTRLISMRSCRRSKPRTGTASPGR